MTERALVWDFEKVRRKEESVRKDWFTDDVDGGWLTGVEDLRWS